MDQITHKVWNLWDEHSAIMSLSRLPGENNKELRVRILNIGKFAENTTRQGLVNALSSALGYDQYNTLTRRIYHLTHVPYRTSTFTVTVDEVAQIQINEDQYTDEGSLWVIYCNALYYAIAANATVHDITTEDLSISAWVKVDAGGGGRAIIAKKDTDVIGGGYIFEVDTNGKLKGLVYPDGIGAAFTMIGTTDIRGGGWYHAAMIIDRDTQANCKVFLDGIDDTASRTGDITTIADATVNVNLILGGHYATDPTVSSIFDGNVADAKIYYAAGAHWSDAQIVYQEANPFDYSSSAGTITEYWRCGDGSGTTVNGSSNNDLTLNSANAWHMRTWDDLLRYIVWKDEEDNYTRILEFLDQPSFTRDSTTRKHDGTKFEITYQYRDGDRIRTHTDKCNPYDEDDESYMGWAPESEGTLKVRSLNDEDWFNNPDNGWKNIDGTPTERLRTVWREVDSAMPSTWGE